MISNTELYYTKMKAFQDKRAELTEAHDKNIKSLERLRGSRAFEEDLKKENDRFETTLTSLQDEYRPSIMTVLGGMMDAVGKRSVSAPTTEQVNLLNVLKMKKKVTLEDCQRTAEAVKDNPIALSIVSEIAHDHGIMHSFNHLCPEMSSQTASDIVTGMKNSLEDFLLYDSPRASRIAKRYHEMNYGSFDVDLPKRKLFTDKEGFYRDEIGLDADSFKQFSEIVDN